MVNLRHGLLEFNVDLVILDEPSESLKGAGTTLSFQRKAAGDPVFFLLEFERN